MKMMWNSTKPDFPSQTRRNHAYTISSPRVESPLHRDTTGCLDPSAIRDRPCGVCTVFTPLPCIAWSKASSARHLFTHVSSRTRPFKPFYPSRRRVSSIEGSSSLSCHVRFCKNVAFDVGAQPPYHHPGLPLPVDMSTLLHT